MTHFVVGQQQIVDNFALNGKDSCAWVICGRVSYGWVICGRVMCGWVMSNVWICDVNVFIVDKWTTIRGHGLMLLKLYRKTWTRTLLSSIQTLGFFSSIDKLSAVKLQSRWERDDIVSMSGEKNRRSFCLLSESNRSCTSENSDLRNLHFVMMWMAVNLIRVEFRSRDDE